jgi:hypothetical protein
MTVDTGSVADIAPDAAPGAHSARCCGVCGRPLQGKQETACSAVCRAKASRLRNPDPAIALRDALQSAPRPLNPASYTEAACITLVREYARWHATVRAAALGKGRPSP